MAPKKNVLTLKEKLEVVKVLENEKLSVRDLAKKFNIGKTQAAQIAKHKEEIRTKCQSGINLDQKKGFLKTEGLNIDSLCYEWFSTARSQNVPVSGPLVKAKAKEVAENLGYNYFTASDGWLQKWCRRHCISFKCLSGKAADINKEDVNQFIEKLPPMLNGYQPEGIYDANESGVFFRVLPDKTLALKSEKCSGEINSYDEALKLIDGLKKFATNDLTAFQHIQNLESHFQKCILEQKIKKLCEISILKFAQITNNKHIK